MTGAGAELADRISERRVAAGVSQVVAAGRAGVTQATWSRWESGVMTPRSDRLVSIAGAVGCSVGDLLT